MKFCLSAIFAVGFVSLGMAQDLKPHVFTAPVEDSRLREIMLRDGRLAEGQVSLSETMNACLFPELIETAGSLDMKTDLSTPIGAYIAYSRAHRIDGTVFDTLEFYMPEERELWGRIWKTMTFEYEHMWPGMCVQKSKAVKGIVEVGDAVFVLHGGFTRMRELDGKWYVSNISKDDHRGWIVLNAHRNGTIVVVDQELSE